MPRSCLRDSWRYSQSSGQSRVISRSRPQHSEQISPRTAGQYRRALRISQILQVICTIQYGSDASIFQGRGGARRGGESREDRRRDRAAVAEAVRGAVGGAVERSARRRMTPTTAGIKQATSNVRFAVLAFAVSLGGITYLDRVCISITAPHIMRELSLDQVQMSFVFSAFTLAYAIFEIPTGYWGDRIGTRRVLTRIVLWWSSFTALTAAAFSYPSLLVVRFLFGIGEAGACPNVAKTFSRWFPSSERGTAQGIFFMGAHLMGGLTPLLVRAMLDHM